MASSVKLSSAQKSALQTIRMWGHRGIYMPFAGAMRTFHALERKGVIEYVRIGENGAEQNGYRIK